MHKLARSTVFIYSDTPHRHIFAQMSPFTPRFSCNCKRTPSFEIVCCSAELFDCLFFACVVWLLQLFCELAHAENNASNKPPKKQRRSRQIWPNPPHRAATTRRKRAQPSQSFRARAKKKERQNGSDRQTREGETWVFCSRSTKRLRRHTFHLTLFLVRGGGLGNKRGVPVQNETSCLTGQPRTGDRKRSRQRCQTSRCNLLQSVPTFAPRKPPKKRLRPGAPATVTGVENCRNESR